MDKKRTWVVFESGRVQELDSGATREGRVAPRDFPAEWGDWFVMQSDTRPGCLQPGCLQPGDLQPGGTTPAATGPAASGPFARPEPAPAVSGPYALHLVSSVAPVTRTDRPGGRPDRRISAGPAHHSDRRQDRRPARQMVERITQRQERTPSGGETRAFQYDAAGRLARVLSNGGLAESYQYDAEGRREREINGRRGHLERRFFYGPDNRLLMTRSGLGCVSYEHDAAGFRSARVEMGGYGANRPERVTRFRYAPDGRLLAAGLPDGRAVEYAHDAQGRRAEKKVNGRAIERYEWLDRIRLRRVVSDGVAMEFLYSGGRLPDLMVRGGRTYRLYFDQVGSLRVVADETGNAVKDVLYDSFGNVLEDANPAFRVPIGFAGGLHDPDTGLVRFGYRDYDPDTGRFTALDPLGDAGGDSDWYGYCLDDPVNLVDPEGLASGEGDGFWGAIGNMGEGIWDAVTKGGSAAKQAVAKGSAAAKEAVGATVDTYANDPRMHEGLKKAGEYAAIGAAIPAATVGTAAAAAMAPETLPVVGRTVAGAAQKVAQGVGRAVTAAKDWVLMNPDKVAGATQIVEDVLSPMTPTTRTGWVKKGYEELDEYLKRTTHGKH
ncbi:MAG: RHS repeat-associated core domain-containing protein [Desulfovibrionaceae bacterium]